MAVTVKARSSLFFKMFLILLATGLLISLVFGVGHMLSDRPEFSPRMSSTMKQFAHYLIADMGSPPLFEKGEALTQKLGVSLRIEGKDWEWCSDDELPLISSLPDYDGVPAPPSPFLRLVPRSLMPLVHLFEPPRRDVATRSFGPYLKFEHEFTDGPAKVLFIGPQRPLSDPSLSLVWVELALILLLLVGSYYVIRAVLKPIKDLEEGVHALSGGNLDYKVPVQTRDELGTLAHAFNAMVRDVKEMIATKQQLLVDVSHELRSPLARAKVGIELLQVSDTTKNLSRDLDELEAMIGKLLETARLESRHGKIERDSVDLVQMAKNIVDRYVSSGKPVAITDNPAKLMARVDTSLMESVFKNLIDNAIKYSPEGKSVSVALSVQPQRARLVIKDDGVGIPASDLEKVFEPFFRVDKSRTRLAGGFGLGLNLCKRIVEAHGGTIQMESQPGIGTTVTILLPV